MMGRVIVLLLALVGFAGCARDLGGSISGGECKVMERPPYAVRGAEPYDQDWIDSTVEGGVGACHWQRPAPRPPELDAVAPRPAPTGKPVAVRPAKKRGLVRRFKDRVWPKTSVAPVAPAPEPPARPVAEDAPFAAPLPAPDVPAPSAAPPKPRRPLTPIEELLHLQPKDDKAAAQ